MPIDIINDDLFLHLMADQIQVSGSVFVNVAATETIDEEINRFRRMKAGKEQLKQAYPILFKNKIEDVLYKEGTIYRALYMLRGASVMEIILYPMVIPIKFLAFKYIHSKACDNCATASINWK
jgi:hypothetical protein